MQASVAAHICSAVASAQCKHKNEYLTQVKRTQSNPNTQSLNKELSSKTTKENDVGRFTRAPSFHESDP